MALLATFERYIFQKIAAKLENNTLKFNGITRKLIKLIIGQQYQLTISTSHSLDWHVSKAADNTDALAEAFAEALSSFGTKDSTYNF